MRKLYQKLRFLRFREGNISPLGTLEEKIMELLWRKNKPLSVKDIHQELGKKFAYTTLLTITTRLYYKRLLKREKIGKAYYYSPQISKEEFQKQILKSLAHFILRESILPSSSFFQGILEEMSKEEKELLKKLIDEKL